jgi:hypothetical protein
MTYLAGALGALITIAAAVGGFFVGRMTKDTPLPSPPKVTKGAVHVLDAGVYPDE